VAEAFSFNTGRRFQWRGSSAELVHAFGRRNTLKPSSEIVLKSTVLPANAACLDSAIPWGGDLETPQYGVFFAGFAVE
jgi:hypothetical protein